ncbi:MAG: 50S ribosomal protein L30 [Gemmatimonadales bacterium]
MLRVRQVKSGVGQARTMRRTLVALGITHHQAEVVVKDNPSVRGMLRKVSHLITIKAEATNV